MSRISRKAMLHIGTYSLLLIVIIALSIIAYSENRSHGYWEGQYNEIVQQNPKSGGTSVTLRLDRFSSVVDITKTEFSNSQQERIEPSLIELYQDWNTMPWEYVTFWFSSKDIIDGRISFHLPNWSNWEGNYYITTHVPYSDHKPYPPDEICGWGFYVCDTSSYGGITCCEKWQDSQLNSQNEIEE